MPSNDFLDEQRAGLADDKRMLSSIREGLAYTKEQLSKSLKAAEETKRLLHLLERAP